jgi:hypothetical protein
VSQRKRNRPGDIRSSRAGERRQVRHEKRSHAEHGNELIEDSAVREVRRRRESLTTICYTMKQSLAALVLVSLFVVDTPCFSQVYPFADKNMFFGLTQLENDAEHLLAADLGVSWLSMYPLVPWFSMEASPGVYDWSSLDAAVRKLQNENLDCTPVLFPVNAFGDKRTSLIQKLAGTDLGGFLRSDSSIYWRLYPNDEDGTTLIWLTFVGKLVERYDDDGIDDMPGLKYPIRNWHLLEEYPMIFIDADSYVTLLKATTPVIKQAYPDARVVLAGLAGNLARYFAYMESFITDDDAGVLDGIKLSKLQIGIRYLGSKQAFEKILHDGIDFYDVADLHLYEEKETFLDGKVAWLKNKLSSFGSTKPVWCIEGGGPLKLTEVQYQAGDTTQGDPYFGWYTDKENAEFVVKLTVMAAADGVERDHWGLSATPPGAFWSGPWNNMALATSDLSLKPSYYDFKLMVRMLQDFTTVTDKSTSDYRMFEFTTGNGKCYVAWSRGGSQTTINVQDAFSGEQSVKVTRLITDLAQGTAPTEETCSPASIPIDITPVFVSKVGYPTGIEPNYISIPTKYGLFQNHPNPFNPATTIRYELPRAAYVSLKIFNVLGQKVAVLVDRHEEAGQHRVVWNGNAPSGIYFYRLQADKYVETKKMILVK